MLAALLERRQQVRYTSGREVLSAVGTQQASRLETAAAQFRGVFAPAAHAKVLLSRLLDQEALLLAFSDAFSLRTHLCLWPGAGPFSSCPCTAGNARAC
jgi:hypothetical protein